MTESEMVLKGSIVKLYPNKEQIIMLNQMFGNDRKVWNLLLDCLNTRHESNPNLYLLSAYDMDYLIKCLKQEYPYLRFSDSSSLQVIAQNLYDAFVAFFKHIRKHPRFHSKNSAKQSYTGKSTGFKVLDENHVKLPKLGIVRTSKTDVFINHKIKRYTVSLKPNGNYYLSVIFESKSQTFKKTGKMVGIDINLENFLATSDGVIIPFDIKNKIKYLDNKIALEQRKLARRRKLAQIEIAFDKENHPDNVKTLFDFSDYIKQRHFVGKLFAKRTNIITDFLHKQSTSLIKRYDVIVIENLNLKRLLKNHHLAKSFTEHSIGKFIAMLEYKCKLYGKTLIKVNPKNTSRICSACGVKNNNFNQLTTNEWLNTREWICPACGTKHNRDVNAAKNILKRGLI